MTTLMDAGSYNGALVGSYELVCRQALQDFAKFSISLSILHQDECHGALLMQLMVIKPGPGGQNATSRSLYM